MNDIIALYFAFLRIGAVNFGGGYAMLPLLERVAGAIAATLGFITVPIIIILLIATFLQGFAHLPVVQNAFAGIRVCVCVLIVEAVMRLWSKSVIDHVSLVMYLVVFLMTALSGVLPVAVPAAILVILSGMLGVLLGRAVPPTGTSGKGGSDK